MGCRCTVTTGAVSCNELWYNLCMPVSLGTQPPACKQGRLLIVSQWPMSLAWRGGGGSTVWSPAMALAFSPKPFPYSKEFLIKPNHVLFASKRGQLSLLPIPLETDFPWKCFSVLTYVEFFSLWLALNVAKILMGHFPIRIFSSPNNLFSQTNIELSMLRVLCFPWKQKSACHQ